jgi:hypothetical protein
MRKLLSKLSLTKMEDCKYHLNKLSEDKKIKPVSKVKGWINNRFVESVFVDGEPAFLVKGKELDKIYCEQEIKYSDKTFQSLQGHEYGYKPYKFTSEEIDQLNSGIISNDEILSDVMKMVKWYVAAPPRDRVLIAGEILLTYCQEWISTVHFPYFVGETESGKSTVLHLGKHLSYRCVVSEDWPHADVYNFLGTTEEGTGTICEDEAQEMGRDREKIRTYKNSYSKGSVKPRVIMTNAGKYQVFYKTFCCKWFAGENVPHDKGFLERLVIVYMLGGKPSGNLKSASFKEQWYLNRLRNKLLFWKMQNIGNDFPRIDSGLAGRDQELWQDFLSMFHGTKFKDQSREVADYYLNQRKESIKESLEAKIFRSIKPLLDESMEIESKTIWKRVTNSDELLGKLDERTENTFYLDEDDRKLTKNSLSDIVRFKFQAKRKIRYEKVEGKRRKITSYIFDEEIVKILSEKYRVDDL